MLWLHLLVELGRKRLCDFDRLSNLPCLVPTPAAPVANPAGWLAGPAQALTSGLFRLLCLHGMYQNAELFATKTQHLRAKHHDLIDFVYVDGPFNTVPRILSQGKKSSHLKSRVRCTKKNDEFRAWWRPAGPHQPSPSQLDDDRDTLLSFLSDKLEEVGEIDGVLGFSQGASLAAWLCTTQARSELRWSPKLAVIIGGYKGPQQYSFSSGIEPDILSLHLYGANDHVISACKSLKLVDVFKKSQTQENQVFAVPHDQGHVVPKSDDLVDQVHAFLGLAATSSPSASRAPASPVEAAAHDPLLECHPVQQQSLERQLFFPTTKATNSHCGRGASRKSSSAEGIMSAEEVAKAFVQHYYTTFDSNRAALGGLYQAQSSLSWEGQMIQGQQAILEKFQQLPPCQHQFTTIDIQPSTSGSAMIIFVLGKLKIEENQPLQFSQVFQLVAHSPGAYYIHNDIFRLQYGATHDSLEKGDAPMLATLRIAELDKLVSRVKQKQANCLMAVEHYEKEIGHIDREVKNIMDRYTPLCKRLEQRRAERKALQDQHDDVAKQFGTILSNTKKQLRASNHEHVRNIRQEAAAELAGARGYSLGRESTVYQRSSTPHSALSPVSPSRNCYPCDCYGVEALDSS
ncbi:TPA: hypothetical protein N0F65_001946 [Lagenidium giganteum]|uniref:NTF2 domain-containing protein n=1 Tax=Lagenidium giganteum TaxID=4803 RepID=A0AAV2YUU2_9STRA|nr:TPA: hypothetical protein N0F65_001946 [Lagenidium giganteum]